MRLLAVLALGLICSGLGFGCGGESSTRKDGGAGRAATSGVGGATAGAETTAATGGRSPRAGAGGVAGASGTGGSAGSVAGGGNAGVGGAGTGSGSGHGGGAGVLGEAGVPSAGEAGSAGAHEIPTKDGLPIGDCTDPTPEELAASGCPPELEYMAPCTEIGAICRTEIRTDASQTSQGYLTCQENGQLNVGVLLTCGSTCDVSAGNDAMLRRDGLQLTSCHGVRYERGDLRRSAARSAEGGSRARASHPGVRRLSHRQSDPGEAAERLPLRALHDSDTVRFHRRLLERHAFPGALVVRGGSDVRELGHVLHVTRTPRSRTRTAPTIPSRPRGREADAWGRPRPQAQPRTRDARRRPSVGAPAAHASR
jgi:hypothetical protein